MASKLSLKNWRKMLPYGGAGLVVLAVVLLYVYRDQIKQRASWWPWGSAAPAAPQEPYVSNVGDLDNVGVLDDGYDVLPQEDPEADEFADLVEGGDHHARAGDGEGLKQIRPAERLRQIQGKQLLPRLSSDVTPYNVDVADPTSYMYMANTPSVVLKDRQRLQADPFRGDIPITYHPDVPLVSRSRYGRDSLRLDGMFSDGMKALYNRHTGREHLNRPLYVVNEETVMDGGF